MYQVEKIMNAPKLSEELIEWAKDAYNRRFYFSTKSTEIK